MDKTQTMRSFHPAIFKTPLWISLLVTNILFFIDEGYNDFRWMKDPGNWLVFLIYMIGIYAVLLAICLLVAVFIRMAKQLAN